MADHIPHSAFIYGDFNGLFRTHFSATTTCKAVLGPSSLAVLDSDGPEHAYAGLDTRPTSCASIVNLHFHTRHPQKNISKTLRPVRVHPRKAAARTAVADNHEFLVILSHSLRKPEDCRVCIGAADRMHQPISSNLFSIPVRLFLGHMPKVMIPIHNSLAKQEASVFFRMVAAIHLGATPAVFGNGVMARHLNEEMNEL